MDLKAVIFDLDGVLVTTDEYHYGAWKRMADEEGITFDRQDNERLRGISRMESLEIILEKANREYSLVEKNALAAKKNRYYRQALLELNETDILDGVQSFLDALDEVGILYAVGSSSKNAPLILQRTGLDKRFDIVVDGNGISRSKPDPEVFLKASKALGIEAGKCLVVEDAKAGVEAALAAGMPVVGVGSASGVEGVTVGYESLAFAKVKDILDM